MNLKCHTFNNFIFVFNIFITVTLIFNLKSRNYQTSNQFFDSKTTKSPTKVNNFRCPTLEQLNKPPENCNSRRKLINSVYTSSFYPIYPPYCNFSIHNDCNKGKQPGPSEQTHGVKHILLAAAQLRKSFMISNFSSHKLDDSSKRTVIPFGARIDLEKLPEHVEELHIVVNIYS